MNQADQKMSADDVEALLPWYAAGTLAAREADQVEAALAADAELARRLELAREEMAETVLLNETLGVPSSRVMENLFKAIDRERGRKRVSAGGGLGGWLMGLFTPRAFALTAGAAVVVMMLQAGVIARLVLQDRVEPRSSFETASAPAPATRGIELGSFALVRFAPQANMADVTRFLDAHDAVIVDGPRPGGPGGMYRVRIARHYVGKDELDRLVREFQSASNLISTAVPTE
jgi:hypothetical protein